MHTHAQCIYGKPTGKAELLCDPSVPGKRPRSLSASHSVNSWQSIPEEAEAAKAADEPLKNPLSASSSDSSSPQLPDEAAAWSYDNITTGTCTRVR